MGKKKKHLSPYSKRGYFKFELEDGREITKEAKQEIKNANRSLKKSERMRLKEQLRKQIEEINFKK